MVLVLSAKPSGNLLIKSSFDTLLIILILSQKPFDAFNHALPIKLGLSSLIKSKLKFETQIPLIVTPTIILPNTVFFTEGL